MCKKYLTSATAGLLACVMSAASAGAATIPGLFNTGVDATGTVLGDGAGDPHYTIDGFGAALVINETSVPSLWLDNDTTSRWIWQEATGLPTNVTRTFTTSFDLTGFDPSTASITGRWAVDNFGDDILINGVSTGQTMVGFASFSNFSITSGFVDGLNTISFVARDVGGISGFRAEFLSATADPEVNVIPVPAALPLMLTALGSFVLWRRRV